ncbi:uncharacterized protein LOC125630330 isoform X7 [Caretta caretta]|uniref:uncharacterized protein LOC125630330 isoform X7 n=1 Tax=Caretta caretta TaxID=8467 RepID=UPI002095DB00|nr:uncharacterized protein LOC125630330 isoform X6 [Caretta caretta]
MAHVRPPSMASARPCSLPQVAASSPSVSFPSSSAATVLTRVRARAEAQLISAIASERAMRWSEVVAHYTALLKTLSKEELPKDFEPGPYYSQLLFETYYHLAVAFQRQNHHQEAVQELNKAIDVASIPKIACRVGCVSRTFLHTPLFARRAYAYVKCDRLKEAIDDANKAVELDPLNPDVYCVRALVWNTMKEKKKALFDLNCSQKLKPCHISTLIIKGIIKNSLMATGDPQFLGKNKDHEKILEEKRGNFYHHHSCVGIVAVTSDFGTLVGIFDHHHYMNEDPNLIYLYCMTPAQWDETAHPALLSLRRTSEGWGSDQNNQMIYLSGEVS